MPNIEIKIWTMDKGKIKEIMIPEFDNQIFVVKEKRETIIKVPSTSVRRIAETPTDRGKTIRLIGKRTGHQNVLDECKQLVEAGNYDFMPVLKKYYPNLRKTSYTRYACDYRQYLGINIGRGRPTKKYFNVPTTTETTPIKKRRRRRKKPSPDCVGFSKTYKTWIKKDEVHKVKLAISTVGFGYVPNTKTIVKQTGLTKSRTSAILDYMISKELVKRVYKNGICQYNLIY